MNAIFWRLDERVSIRTFALDDAEEAFALVEANRDRLRPWMPWEPRTTTSADTRVFIESALASENSVEATGIWVAGGLAGAAGLSVDRPNECGELGYWIARGLEGQGIVTRACRALIEHGFAELGLRRIQLHAAVGNVRSRAVARRLGMKQEGILRQAERVADGYNDLVVYGVLREEWATTT